MGKGVCVETRTTIRLPPDLHKRIEEARRTYPVNINQICVDAIIEYLDTIGDRVKAERAKRISELEKELEELRKAQEER